MSVTAFFEKFMGLQQQKVQATVASFRELVAGIAAGEEPNPAEVERLLASAGKSVDDLRLDVERYQHRMALKAAAAAMPGLEAERRTLDEQIAAADKLLEAAENQHTETTRPFYFRRREVDQAISEGTTARMELVYSCEDANLRRETDELEVEQRRLDEALRDLNIRAGRLDYKACYEREAAGHELINSEATRRREQAATHEKEAEAIRREAKKVERQQADLTKRREQIEDRMRQV